MLSSAQLAAFQAAANSAMDQSIQVMRSTPTKTSSGHFTAVWNNVGSPVLGNLAQPTGNQMQNYGYEIGSEDSWLVRLPVGTNVVGNDRLVVGGKTFRVQFILQPQSYQTAMRLLASAIPTSGID
jgi:hypothetical protein